jgi:hypothetical protein
MKLPLSFTPNLNFSRDLDFPEESPGQSFLNREFIFRQALQRLLALCAERRSHAPEAFICHAHGEAGFERWVAREFAPLLKLAGIRPILDKTDNGPGTCLIEFMDRILSVERVLVIGTPLFYQKSLPGSDSTVSREVQRIVERMRNDKKKDSVIPVLLAGEERISLPRVLWERVYVDLRSMDRYHAQMFDLILQLYGFLDDAAVQDWRYEIQDGRPLLC